MPVIYNKQRKRWELFQISKSYCYLCGKKLTPDTDYSLKISFLQPKWEEVDGACWSDDDGITHVGSYWRVNKSHRTIKNKHICTQCFDQLKKKLV